MKTMHSKRTMIMTTKTMSVGLILMAAATMAHAKMGADEIAAAQGAFNSNGCSGCHMATESVVGPALSEIAKRYRGTKVEAEIAGRIRTGSTGRWGQGMHPANEAIEPADATLLAKWILNGAP